MYLHCSTNTRGKQKETKCSIHESINTLQSILKIYYCVVIKKVTFSMIIQGERKACDTCYVKHQGINYITVHAFTYNHISAGSLCLFSEKRNSLFFFYFIFLTSLLEYNCFTMVCQFLLYNKENQLYIYIYPRISSLLSSLNLRSPKIGRAHV